MDARAPECAKVRGAARSMGRDACDATDSSGAVLHELCRQQALKGAYLKEAQGYMDMLNNTSFITIII